MTAYIAILRALINPKIVQAVISKAAAIVDRLRLRLANKMDKEIITKNGQELIC